MYFSSFLCLLIVSNISFTIGFPFFVRTYPKTVVRYNTVPIPAPIRTIPAFPLNNQFIQKRRTQFQQTSNKVDVFPDDQYIEQRKIDDREDSPNDESSDLHPIYVLPPPNFQPIVYPSTRSDVLPPGPKGLTEGGYLLKRQIPYEYPKGVSSWILGGLSGIQRGNYWEQLTPDLALNTPIKAQQPKPVVIYLKRTTEPVQHKWSTIPIYEAHSVLNEETNYINSILNKSKNKTKINVKNQNKVMKTKLPVGLTSFFLGGMRGVSGRHWQMPSELVSQVEFMPNDDIVIDKQKNSKPGVYFDDDFYNYNIIK